MKISFEDTKTAFAYKSDKELKNARFLFATMGKEWLVSLGLKLTPWALRIGLPVKGIIRNTIFQQFVGGESLEKTVSAVNKLADFGVKVILDYGVEGKQGEENYDAATETFVKVIEYAASQPNIPYMSIKMTGLARFGLMEKLHEAAMYQDVTEGKLNLSTLTAQEKEEWKRVEMRIDRICKEAQKAGIGVLVDAEETWIQHPVDALVTSMMATYNQGVPVIYNTVQLYRHDRVQFLKDNNEFAKKSGFVNGMKLVRGAYMEKERARAEELNYPDPINPDKPATDHEFNEAVAYCVDPANNMYVVIGSHNDYSNQLAVELMDQFSIPRNTDRIYFSQLYGMSDNITFNLAREGCNASKYLPFGPIKDVIPYLMRRAQENSSVSGQTGRELSLIQKEIKRRGI